MKEAFDKQLDAVVEEFISPDAFKNPKPLVKFSLSMNLIMYDLQVPNRSTSLKWVDVQAIEESLKPIIAASPKNEHGRLGDGAARYALHRLFMERHGWEIKGFGDFAVKAQGDCFSFPVFCIGRRASRPNTTS